MTDVEHALELLLESLLVGEAGAAPVEWMTRGSLQASLAYSRIRTAHASGPSDRVQGLLEPIGMRALGFRQRLEPVGDLGEALFASLLRHSRVHVAVLVRFAGDGCLEVHLGLADRQSRRRVAHRFEVLEMSVRVTRLTFRGGTENRRDIVVA